MVALAAPVWRQDAHSSLAPTRSGAKSLPACSPACPPACPPACLSGLPWLIGLLPDRLPACLLGLTACLLD
eukprot:11931112-Alexandrium_andersonii.AAC.1